MINGFNELVIDERIKKKITTQLPLDVYKYIKLNGWQMNHLIRTGILAKENNPQLIDRVREIEDKFRRIESKLDGLILILKDKNI